jgi:hypothetical protein
VAACTKERSVKKYASILLLIGCIFSLPGLGRADSGNYQMIGGFTSFSGVVGGDASPNYIRAFGLGLRSIDCSVINCSDPLLFFDQVCPDAGCLAAGGMATNYSLLSAGEPTNYLTLQSFSCIASQPLCANTPNELDFVPSPGSILSLNQNTGESEMLLGALTFTNGTWTGNADFGITITATDISAPHNAYTFNGFVHMQLNTAQPGLPNAGQIAHGDADCISLTNSAGQPVTDPQTRLSMGDFCAYELNNPLGASNTVVVNLYGTINSLDPTRYGDLTGGGFLDSPSVPEPAQWPVVGGVLALAAMRLRRQRPIAHKS